MSFKIPRARDLDTTQLGGSFPGSKPPVRFGRINTDELTLSQLTGGLGDKIETIRWSYAASIDPTPVSIRNFEAIASYSWLKSADPTIIVPGSPPVWKNRSMPYGVPRDTGSAPIGHQAKELSTSPLFPLLAAVAQYAPLFSLASVDFVTNRNGLRKLWRWSYGDSNNFRIDVELVGTRTILMERWEPPTQRGSPGYELEFEKASTEPAKGCEGTDGHTRIVTYDLGGLKMLVRSKTDATLFGQPDSEDHNKDPIDNLASEVESLSVATPPDTHIPTFGGAFLTIIHKGVLVPQSSTVELKTRSHQSVKRFDWDEAYPQLLLSQTSHMFLCVHDRGQFYEARKRTLEELREEEMADNAHDSLRHLRKALGEISELARRKGQGKKLSLVFTAGEMHVYEAKGGAMSLPSAILEKFVQ